MNIEPMILLVHRQRVTMRGRKGSNQDYSAFSNLLTVNCRTTEHEEWWTLGKARCAEHGSLVLDYHVGRRDFVVPEQGNGAYMLANIIENAMDY